MKHTQQNQEPSTNITPNLQMRNIAKIIKSASILEGPENKVILQRDLVDETQEK